MSQAVAGTLADSCFKHLSTTAKVHFAALTFLFVLEAVVFYSQLASRITPFYPTAFDQTGYFLETYRLLDHFQGDGWNTFVMPFLQPSSATGITFSVQGALLALIGGSNRTAIVSLNLAYFIALQLALFTTVRSCFRSSSLAWMSIGLLLSLGTFFNFAGGLFDYRIDFSALCLYGIWICLVIRSEKFKDRSFALLITAMGVWLILLRFFTIAYLGLIFGGMLAALLVAAIYNSDSLSREAAKQRSWNLFISGVLTAALSAPFLYAARHHIYQYYGVGHFLGSEKYIRATENKVLVFFDHLTYYPSTLFHTHMGPLTLRLVAAIVLITILLAVLPGWRSFVKQLRSNRSYGFEIWTLVLAICVPLLLLTVNVAKSPVVGGIVVVPVILLVTTVCAWLGVGQDNSEARGGQSQPAIAEITRAELSARASLARISATAMCGLVLIAGIAGFVRAAAVDPPEPSRLVRSQYVALNEAIAHFVFDNEMTRPSISFDRVSDSLNTATIELYGYERYRQFKNYVPRFGQGPTGIFATPRDVAMRLVSESDLIVLTDPTIERGHPYPSNTKIREYWREMRKWATDHLALVLTDNIAGIPHEVFAKPAFRLGGVSRGWITSSGLSLNVDSVHLMRWPFLVLEGPTIESELAFLGGVPKPRAAVVEGRDEGELPATLRLDRGSYTVVIDARSLATSERGRKQIRLTFDRKFVPSRAFASLDSRELVLRAPATSVLRATSPN